MISPYIWHLSPYNEGVDPEENPREAARKTNRCFCVFHLDAKIHNTPECPEWIKLNEGPVLPPGGEIGQARMTDTSGNCWREGPKFDLPNPKGVQNCPKGKVLNEGINTQNKSKLTITPTNLSLILGGTKNLTYLGV